MSNLAECSPTDMCGLMGVGVGGGDVIGSKIKVTTKSQNIKNK